MRVFESRFYTHSLCFQKQISDFKNKSNICVLCFLLEYSTEESHGQLLSVSWHGPRVTPDLTLVLLEILGSQIHASLLCFLSVPINRPCGFPPPLSNVVMYSWFFSLPWQNIRQKQHKRGRVCLGSWFPRGRYVVVRLHALGWDIVAAGTCGRACLHDRKDAGRRECWSSAGFLLFLPLFHRGPQLWNWSCTHSGWVSFGNTLTNTFRKDRWREKKRDGKWKKKGWREKEKEGEAPAHQLPRWLEI